jgi:carbon monoxide dehydrogenase subunit G
MARFATTVNSALSPEQAFDLLANFESVADWDPGVSHAERLDEGELGLGSSFAVVVVLGPWRIRLTYVVREWVPGARVALEAVDGGFTSYDVIRVDPDDAGSKVTYDATLSLHGWRRPFDLGLQAAFAVIGRRTQAGLGRALNPALVAS